MSADVTPKSYIWGWATWADRWNSFRSAEARLDAGPRIANLAEARRKVPRVFEEVERGKGLQSSGAIDTWDYAWAFELFSNKQFCVLPPTNLIENFGI